MDRKALIFPWYARPEIDVRRGGCSRAASLHC
jgi:hypothetical protein